MGEYVVMRRRSIHDDPRVGRCRSRPIHWNAEIGCANTRPIHGNTGIGRGKSRPTGKSLYIGCGQLIATLNVQTKFAPRNPPSNATENPMTTAIKDTNCATAEDLLNELHRANPLWGGMRPFWVFRGHQPCIQSSR